MTDDEVAQIGRALGDPNRLAIYTQIAQHDELFCGEMHAKHTISPATLSHHLKVLHDRYWTVFKAGAFDTMPRWPSGADPVPPTNPAPAPATETTIRRSGVRRLFGRGA